MVKIDRNTITVALSVIAAIIVLSSIIALQIKSYLRHRRNQEEEQRLNAETDNTSIELPSRGFSLLRAFNRAVYSQNSATPQPDYESPPRGASILRALNRPSRWGSRRAAPNSDVENQTTGYRSPSVADTRDEIQTRARSPYEQRPTLFLYQSRGHQWSRVSLDSPRPTAETPGDEYFSLVPRASEYISNFVDQEQHHSGDIGPTSSIDWRDHVAYVPTERYQPFRKGAEHVSA